MEHALRVLRVGVAIALACLAVLAALLARDMHSWRNSIAQGDAVYAVAPARAVWTPSTLLGGTGEALLGVDDDVTFRRALQLYAKAASIPNRLDTAVGRQSLRAQAARALANAGKGAHVS